MRRNLLVSITMLSSAVAFAVLMGSHAAAQTGWKMAPALPKPLGEIMGAVVGNHWYVLAGLDSETRRPFGVVYDFDNASARWTEKRSMPVPAHHVMVAALNGKIYVFGGFVAPEQGGWSATDRCWVYDPATDTWSELAKMPTPRGAGWASEVSGKIYVIGGAQANVPGNPSAPLTPGSPQLVLGTVEAYDPMSNTWQARALMPTPRNHLLAAEVGRKIYAIGGRLAAAQITVADDTNVVEAYDPVQDRWSNQGRAPIHRSGMAGGSFNDKIYIAGGEYQDWEGAKAFWAVQSYDAALDRWDTLPRMQLAHHGLAAGFIGSRFHIAGGGFQSDGMPGVNTKMAVHEVLDITP